MNKTAILEFDDGKITLERVGKNVGDIAIIERNGSPFAIPFGESLRVEGSVGGRIRLIQDGVTATILPYAAFRVNIKEPNAYSGESSEVAP